MDKNKSNEKHQKNDNNNGEKPGLVYSLNPYLKYPEPREVTNLPTEATVEKKRRRLPSYCQIVLMPMFAAMSKIINHLYLTSLGGMTQENFMKNKITCIINATYEAPNLRKPGVECIRVPVDDSPEDDIQEYFDLIADKIQEKITVQKANVVVHCVAGVSRSTSLVIAYLMKYHKLNLRTAFNFVHARRPVVRPNNGFFKQLLNFELKLFGYNSCKMIQLNVNGINIEIPDFFQTEHKGFIILESLKEKSKSKSKSKSKETKKQSKTSNQSKNSQCKSKNSETNLELLIKENQKKKLLEKFMLNKTKTVEKEKKKN